MKFLFIYIFFSFILSCSFINKKSENKQRTLHEITSLGTRSSLNKTDADKEKLKLNETSRGLYHTPYESLDLKKFNNRQQKKRHKVLALFLGPGGHNVYCHVSLIRSLEKNGIPIDIISGIGLGGLVAALYSISKNTELVEWELFNFFSTLRKKENYYSKSWNKKVYRYLKKKFKNLTFEKLSTLLVLPLYDSELRYLGVATQGPMLNKLYANMVYFNYPSFYDIYHKRVLVNKGADVILYLDVLGRNFKAFYQKNGKKFRRKFTPLKRIQQVDDSNLFVVRSNDSNVDLGIKSYTDEHKINCEDKSIKLVELISQKMNERE